MKRFLLAVALCLASAALCDRAEANGGVTGFRFRFVPQRVRFVFAAPSYNVQTYAPPVTFGGCGGYDPAAFGLQYGAGGCGATFGAGYGVPFTFRDHAVNQFRFRFRGFGY